MSQTRFPDSPLLWLRDIATYLNQKLVYTNQDEFTNFGGDPSSILTANMRKVINVMFQKCSDSMKETFFETCISNTAHELQKGSKTIEWVAKPATKMIKYLDIWRSERCWMEHFNPVTGWKQSQPGHSKYPEIHRVEELLSEQTKYWLGSPLVCRAGRCQKSTFRN